MSLFVARCSARPAAYEGNAPIAENHQQLSSCISTLLRILKEQRRCFLSMRTGVALFPACFLVQQTYAETQHIEGARCHLP